MEKPRNILNDWLQTQEGKAYLEACSKYLIKAKEKHMRSQDEVLWDSSRNYEQKVLDLSTELYFFLNDNQRVFDTIQTLIDTNSKKKAISILTLKYHNHLKDINRGSQGTFFPNLYRKIQLSIARHDDFTVSSCKGMSYYAAIKDADLPIIEQTFFQTTSVEDYPYPEKLSKWKNEKDVLAWAGFFWERTRDITGYDCLVPVRELTYYLINKKCVHSSTPAFSDSLCTSDQGKDFNIHEIIADSNPGAGISREMLQDLARATVQDWDEKTAKAFYLYYNEQMTLEATAAEVGYSGPSGVRNVIRKAIHSIRDKTSSWPGFYEDLMNEEANKCFLENIFIFCKLRAFDRK